MQSWTRVRRSRLQQFQELFGGKAGLVEDGFEGSALELAIVHRQRDAQLRLVGMFKDVMAAARAMNEKPRRSSARNTRLGLQAGRRATLRKRDADVLFDWRQRDGNVLRDGAALFAQAFQIRFDRVFRHRPSFFECLALGNEARQGRTGYDIATFCRGLKQDGVIVFFFGFHSLLIFFGLTCKTIDGNLPPSSGYQDGGFRQLRSLLNQFPQVFRGSVDLSRLAFKNCTNSAK